MNLFSVVYWTPTIAEHIHMPHCARKAYFSMKIWKIKLVLWKNNSFWLFNSSLWNLHGFLFPYITFSWHLVPNEIIFQTTSMYYPNRQTFWLPNLRIWHLLRKGQIVLHNKFVFLHCHSVNFSMSWQFVYFIWCT